jgi:hypothetical protein
MPEIQVFISTAIRHLSYSHPVKMSYFTGMKTYLFRRTFRLLLLNATLVVLAAGCATHQERSYNKDFNQNLPTSPKYFIENVDDTHFRVTVHQGSPMPGTQRIVFVKQVASTVAEDEAKRKGWQKWDLNYIQERDQGWMHIVIADVTRKNAVEKSDSTR